MCRICGRMVKCIFDSMPSRTRIRTSKRFLMTRSNIRGHAISQHASSSDLLRSALNINQTMSSHLPPTFLLPGRRRIHQTTTQYLATASVQFEHTHAQIPSALMQPTTPVPQKIFENNTLPDPTTNEVTSLNQSNPKPLVLSKSLQSLLPNLYAQKPHYITAHIHRFPYLLTAGDTLRLPFHMHGVLPGDILRLNRASILGSRDYTLKAGTNSTETYDSKRTGEPNYIDERLFECRARVMGLDSGPLMVKEKTKRRNRRVKKAKSKHKYTVLKIVDVKLKSLEELKIMQGTLLLES